MSAESKPVGQTVVQGCGRRIDFSADTCGRNGVICEWCQNRDGRWNHALDGLQCLAFVGRDDDRQRQHQEASKQVRGSKTPLAYVAEITAVEGQYVWVVLPDESEPRKVHWCNVRPLAPLEQEASRVHDEGDDEFAPESDEKEEPA